MRKTFGTGLVFLCMLLAPLVASGMTALGDAALSACRAGSGVSLDMTGTERIHVGSLWLQDTDTGNAFELNNIVWDNGSGGGFSVSTPAGDPVTFDVGTNAGGRTLLFLHDSTQVSPRTFSANLHFLEYYPGATDVENYDPGFYDPVLDIHDHVTDYKVHDLGSIKVSDIMRTENSLLIGAHGGIDFEHGEKIDIGSARYQYNTTLGDNPATTTIVETDFVLNALTFSGVHFSGAGDSGPFKTGDIAGGNPAQIDIGTNAAGVTAVILELPMTGNIRVDNVTFGTKDLGPLALEGLNVHRLTIQFTP